MFLALLFSLTASAAYHAPVNVASLSACDSHALEIEMNVDGQTSKSQIVDAIKLLADYPSFTITPQHSEQSTIRFLARLNDNCMSDSCARATGWFDLQQRLNRLKGVVVSCADQQSKANREMPRMPGEAPPGGGKPQWPPPPGRGGVTGGN